MKRACIITYDEYRNIPYVNDYEEILTSNEIEYDFIFWNRSEDNIASYNGKGTAHIFDWRVKKSKISKILPFFLWSRFARKVLKNNNYDFLVVCTTIPAVLLADKLIRKYNGKYLFDIRDFTYENIGLYKAVLKKLVVASGINVISSKGFLKWLPEGGEYVCTHNITMH